MMHQMTRQLTRQLTHPRRCTFAGHCPVLSRLELPTSEKVIRCPLACRANAHKVSDAGTALFHCTFRKRISCRLPCASCGQALDILAVEVRLVVDVDREDQPVLYPLVNGLSLHSKVLAHLLHAHQLPWSLLGEKAGEGSMDLFAQRRAMKLMRKAVSLW